MSKRQFNAGFADLAGDTFNSLQVQNLVGRNPVKWDVRCLLCQSRWSELHSVLTGGGARCRNDACFKRQEDEARSLATGRLVTQRDPHSSFSPDDLDIPGKIPW